MINAVINQLKAQQLNGQPLFSKVEEAINLASAMKSSINGSVAYVVEVSRRPGNNQRDMGKPFQLVKTTIGVVIGVGKRNDPTGSKAKSMVDPILIKTRSALFGFSPTTQHQPFLCGAADTIGVNNNGLWKLERFITEHHEEATNG